jgi:hypothetical protein
MELIRELDPRPPRQIRHTMVRGRDGNCYKVLTYRLYDRPPPPEFQNFELNVQLVQENGGYQELFVPYFRRFFDQAKALEAHDRLLESFDDTLELEAPAAGHKEKEKEKAEGH